MRVNQLFCVVSESACVVCVGEGARVYVFHFTVFCVSEYVLYSSGMYVGLHILTTPQNRNYIIYWVSNNIYHWRMLYKYKNWM